MEPDMSLFTEICDFLGDLFGKSYTKEELEFYLNLKKITDKYGFTIFPFMRLADIIRTSDDSLEFNKICV